MSVYRGAVRGQTRVQLPLEAQLEQEPHIRTQHRILRSPSATGTPRGST